MAKINRPGCGEELTPHDRLVLIRVIMSDMLAGSIKSPDDYRVFIGELVMLSDVEDSTHMHKDPEVQQSGKKHVH